MDLQNIRNELNTIRGSENGLTEDQKNLDLIVNADPEFLGALPDEQKNALTNINNNTGGWVNNLASNNDYRKIWFYYLAYTNNKNKGTTAFANKIVDLDKKVQAADTAIANIEKIAGEISGATALTAYARQFRRAETQHRNNANTQRTYLYASVAVFIVILVLALFVSISDAGFLKAHLSAELKRNIDIASVAIKLALIIGWTQVIRFFNKNYNAEKHLEQVATHRKDVLQSLHAVYTAITDLAEKDEIIKIGVAAAFQPYETGYISRREGAGSQEDILTGLISKIR